MTTSFRTIVCATDLSPASLPAVRCAAKLARSVGARVILAHAVPSAADLSVPHAMMPALAAPDMTLAAEELRRGAHEELVELAEKELGAEIEWEVVLGRGNAAEEVERIARAKHADVVVIGTHGRTGLSRVVLGSVAEAVVRRAPCAVLTVRSSLG